MDYKNIIFFLTNLPSLIALVLIIKNYLRFPKALKVISWYVVLSTVVQILSQYLSSQAINNLFLLHFFVPTSFVLFSLFYQNIFDRYINRKIIWWILIVFTVFTIINSLLWQNIKTFNSYALSLESLLLIIYSLSLFTLLLNPFVRQQKKAQLTSLIWINSGIFLYYTTGLLLFYSGDILTQFSSVKFRVSWFFHSIIYIIFFVCIIIGLWKHPKK